MPGKRPSTAFVKLDHSLLDSEAWLHLDPHAFKLLVAIWRRHTGKNNGGIPYSIREAMQLLGCGQHRAKACFDELVGKGFLTIARESSFNIKSRVSREWAITAVGDRGAQASDAYQKWKAPT
ncbi:MAG: hypothetical protein RLO50_14460 [Azospirillaceae bacterium]